MNVKKKGFTFFLIFSTYLINKGLNRTMQDDTSIVKPYLTKDDGLDYSLLWADIMKITGFQAQKNRESRYKEVTDAYGRYKEFAENHLSESIEHTSPMGRTLHPTSKVTGPPTSPCDWITYEKGNKGDNDWIIKAWGRKVTFEELVQLFIELYKNEDRIYPPPRYKGGNMLLEFLHECIIEKGVTWKTLKKYKLVPDF